MRYAIYFAAAQDTDLMKLGASWLGRDPFTGKAIAQPEIGGMSADRFADLTSDPRRYGFHGTLRAPFHLASGKSEAHLISACEAFSAQQAPFESAGLTVSAIGKFLALIPPKPDAALNSFANACVRHFEPLRAPLSDDDLARRRQSNLSEQQEAMLEAWGYPYIFDEFRFHMTLSNKLEDDQDRALLVTAAERYFASVTDKPARVSTFGLYVEPERGAPFQVHTIFQLKGNTPSASI